jgi:CubicO group peptidase (beta-lactamase class C family)
MTEGEVKMTDRNKRDYWPTHNWRVSNPFDQGMNTKILFNLFNGIQLNNDAYNGVLIIKNGYIVAEGYFHPHHKDYLTQIFCITKTFMATLVGILIKEGKIKSVDQKVIDFFDPKNVDNFSVFKSEMTIKNLLTSTTGLAWGDINNETPADIEAILNLYSSTNEWGKTCFDREVIYRPGTLVNITSVGIQILGLIIKKVTGMSPYGYMKEKLLNPLGIKNSLWYTSANDENTISHGLCMTPRDLAKLGLLYLSNGYWENNLLIDPGFVNEATSIQYETRDVHKNDNIVGHGYQWFMLSGLPYETYYAYGFLGQTLFVVKELDLVCVTSSNLPPDRHKRMAYELFKNFVMPSCVNFDQDKNDPKIYNKLQELLYNAEHPEPRDEVNCNKDLIKSLNGLKYNFDQANTFMFVENMFNEFQVKTLTFKFINEKACKLEVVTDDCYFNILISLTTNFLTTKVMTKYGEILISARGVFENDDTFKIMYSKSFGMENVIKVIPKGNKYIECDISNYFTQGIKKGCV